jgi:hypothetical protein
LQESKKDKTSQYKLAGFHYLKSPLAGLLTLISALEFTLGGKKKSKEITKKIKQRAHELDFRIQLLLTFLTLGLGTKQNLEYFDLNVFKAKRLKVQEGVSIEMLSDKYLLGLTIDYLRKICRPEPVVSKNGKRVSFRFESEIQKGQGYTSDQSFEREMIIAVCSFWANQLKGKLKKEKVGSKEFFILDIINRA